LFEDGSPNHARRWCDTAGCGNRDRVRRARSRAAVAPKSHVDAPASNR
jgi:predicted RNA-binding Zn ribbon-like protein